MQAKNKSPGRIVSIQNRRTQKQFINRPVKTPRLFEIQKPEDDSRASLQFPFTTLNSSGVDFAQFDSQFGGSVTPQARISLRRPTIQQSYSFPTTSYSDLPQSRPSLPSGRSWSLFKGHPAKKINMGTGSYSLTVSL